MCIGRRSVAARRVSTVDIPRGASHDRCRRAVLDGLKARLDQLLRDHSRSDPRAYASGLRDALLEAKVGLARMSEAITASEQELAAERRQLEDAERRGRLAAAVPDQETVTIAERFSVRHRERIEVLTRKLTVQRDERALAQREVGEITAEAEARRLDRQLRVHRRCLARPRGGRRRAPGRRRSRRRERGASAPRRSHRGAARLPEAEDGEEAVSGPLPFPLLFSLALTISAAPLASQQPIVAPSHLQKLAHTYSIVAWDSATGDLGVAVQSKFPNVGGIVPWARAGIGAVATQSLGNTAFGERGLELLAQGATAEEALRIVMRTDTMLQDRQVGIVDARGNAASFSGTRTFDWSGGRVGATTGRGNLPGGKGAVIVGHGFAAQANIMVADQTVKNLAETFERSKGNLADRLMAALKAGQAGGGDKRGMQSAALLVVRKNGGYLGANDRFIDIRVYDAPNPITELERLLALHKLHFFPSEPADLLPDHARHRRPARADPARRAGQPARQVARSGSRDQPTRNFSRG